MIDTEIMDEFTAAKYLGLKVSFLQMRRHKKLLPIFYKLGRIVRYRKSDLDAFLEAGKCEGRKSANEPQA